MEAMRSHLCGDAHEHEVEYRIQAKDGSWRWYYDRVSITVRDEHGAPVFLAGIVFDVTERKNREQELENITIALSEDASTDALTGMRNRRATVEMLQAETARSRTCGSPVSLVIFDIDFFKKVNDSWAIWRAMRYCRAWRRLSGRRREVRIWRGVTAGKNLC